MRRSQQLTVVEEENEKITSELKESEINRKMLATELDETVKDTRYQFKHAKPIFCCFVDFIQIPPQKSFNVLKFQNYLEIALFCIKHIL